MEKWVAVNPALTSTGFFCSAPETCDDCARTPPASFGVSCVSGHCQVIRTP
jgi:hypothetical protein